MKDLVIGVEGKLKITVILENGYKITRSCNLVGNYGTAMLATLLSGGTVANQMEYIAIGDGTTVEDVADTALENELSRLLATVTQGTSAKANEVVFESTWTSGTAQGTYTEAGIFDAATDGNMFSRSVFAPVVVGAADTLIVNWTVKILGV